MPLPWKKLDSGLFLLVNLAGLAREMAGHLRDSTLSIQIVAPYMEIP
jgi:hypothetical protein